jgi:hypothetical protein
MLVNCTAIGNRATWYQGGGGIFCDSSSTYAVRVLNSIVIDNYDTPYFSGQEDNYGSSYPGPVIGFFNSCSYSMYGSLPGSNNITASPQLLDGIHLSSTSPCRGTGNAAYSSGFDIDGEPWANPPSMGCDEYWEAGIVGPLSVGLSLAYPGDAVAGYRTWVQGSIYGRATRTAWDYGDGSFVTNASYLGSTHVWTNVGDYIVTFTAFNADNPGGVSTNLPVHVVPMVIPELSSVAWGSNNFTFTVPAQNSVNYMVLSTTNLAPPVSWQPLRVITGYGTNQQFSDTPSDAARFYRLEILQ